MLGTGTDEGDTAGLTDLGELRVLSKESVSRMDRFAIGYFSGADDGRYVQIALQRIGRADANALVREPPLLATSIFEKSLKAFTPGR
jgi:hypothetical protein